ncbi:DUF3825 domain-containing protein [Streptomyces sp. BE133]|uniref:DUF3825 domain-containing protein n=1 Tax=Streptomyces sp. BE133 TaxID=3002523 RepID=UPI002E79C69E|nr:DUF3825 domain-containing protein [Streptomyces sp. BE133]
MRGQLSVFAWLGHIRLAEERQAGTGSADAFDELAGMAVDEPWDRFSHAEQDSLAVLKHYVTWTFEQSLVTNSVLPGPDSQSCVSNTGLITPRHEDIYGYFQPNRQADRQDWYLVGWRVAGAPQLDAYTELPQAGAYSQDAHAYVFDWDLPVSFVARQFTSMVSSLFPAALKEIPLGLELALDGAVNRAIDIAKRNPGTAVPAWQPGNAELQLLLPLYLANPETPDAALVISRGDMSYRSTAIVSLADAYKAARLVARPTAHWVNPPHVDQIPHRCAFLPTPHPQRAGVGVPASARPTPAATSHRHAPYRCHLLTDPFFVRPSCLEGKACPRYQPRPSPGSLSSGPGDRSHPPDEAAPPAPRKWRCSTSRPGTRWTAWRASTTRQLRRSAQRCSPKAST